VSLDEAGRSEDEQERLAAVDRAKASFSRLLEEADAAPLFRANAMLGMAVASETSRDFDGAEASYQQLASYAEEHRLDALKMRATAGLEQLDRLKVEVVFATETTQFEMPAMPEGLPSLEPFDSFDPIVTPPQEPELPADIAP